MKRDEKGCPKCGGIESIDKDLKCNSCGSHLEADEETGGFRLKLKNCPSCGYSNSAGANFCAKCRRKISEKGDLKENKRKLQYVLIPVLAVILILFSAIKIYSYVFPACPAKPAEPVIITIPFEPTVINTPLAVPTASPVPAGICPRCGSKLVQVEAYWQYDYPKITDEYRTAMVCGECGWGYPENCIGGICKINTVRMDVVFCIDTTGSMGDEIAVIKSELLKMVEEICQGNPPPEVRFGVVAYRDRGDDYVTKKYLLTSDINETQKIIDSLVAGGGGDYPESVNEGLHVSVQEMNWDEEESVKKIVFLIGDASPHNDYQDDYSYKREMKIAGEKGIMINTISCSGMQEEGNQVFKEVAAATNGAFDYLTYRYAYEDERGNKHVILNQAGKDYMVEEGYAEDESWRKGASDMAVSDKAKECPEASVETTGSGRTETVNNLDSIMTDCLKEEAEKSGVTY